MPVFAGDITERPYRVIGEVKAGVRKATVFSKSSSEAKIYRELWERARKMVRMRSLTRAMASRM
ncbi:MAG: hypothetical protein PGN08_02105 [Sphingomonas taxi]